MELVYLDEHKLKNLTIDALKIKGDDRVKSYAKFNFQILDLKIGKKKAITCDVELMSVYKSFERRRAREIVVDVSPAIIPQNPPPIFFSS